MKNMPRTIFGKSGRSLSTNSIGPGRKFIYIQLEYIKYKVILMIQYQNQKDLVCILDMLRKMKVNRRYQGQVHSNLSFI
jgi:hypothetical protein